VSDVGTDPLAGGFYTMRDAERLLSIGSTRRVRRWVAGDAACAAVIDKDYEAIDGSQALSFLDLVEVRFLEHFRRQGVPLQTLRRAAARAREELGEKHPFALSHIRFLTDRRRIFAEAARDSADAATWDLATNQYEMYAVLEASLAKGVAFDPASDLAESFHPLTEFANVIADPRFAFGRPVIGEKHVPTAALVRLWKAEGQRSERVADAFGLEPSEVEEAVRFEAALAA
jgi:uncharacterized protein (DUF433 family)